MELKTLLSNIDKYKPLLYGNLKNICDLQTVRLYVKGQTFFDSSILYLTSTSNMPEKDQPGNFTILCHGEAKDWSVYNGSTFTVVYLTSCDSYQELFNSVQEQLTEVQQITAGMHIMVNALFSDQGLQNLVDVAANVFGNPIYVVDLQHKYLAISTGVFSNNNFLLQESESGYISDEGIQLIRKYKLDEKVRSCNTPYYFDNPLHKQGMLIEVILIQGIEIGHVMLQESERKINEFDNTLFHRFAQLVAMELQKNDIFTHNKGVMYSYFLADLLNNPKVNSSYVSNRLQTLGYNLKEDLYVLAIPSTSYHSANVRLNIILEQLRNILTTSIYVIYEDSIVFLISKERYKGFSDFDLERLRDFLTANHLKAGISNFFSSLNDTSRFYNQAIEAVKLGIKMEDPSPICYYSDYYIYQMIELCEQNDSEVRFLIHPGLMQLYNYDKENSTCLIKTLQEYLKHPGKSSKIAADLHIHKNTLLYRMGKIKEISNCQFEEGEDFMYLSLSFKIMTYLNMI